MVVNKVCRKCGKIGEFYIRKDTGKYRGVCKECWSKDSKEYRKDNVEFIREMKLLWQNNHKEKRREINKRYLEKNRDKINEYNRLYKKEKQSLSARLIANYRGRIWKAIKRGDKADHTIELLGCSIDVFKKYIEKQFFGGMCWENYGEWHIDHKKPCSSFNMLDNEEQRVCFNYKNLQPLWAKDNRLKSDKWKKVML